MRDDERQRLRLRVIRVSLDAALRSAASPEVRDAAVARAQGLLAALDDEVEDAGLRRDVESLRSDVAGRLGRQQRPTERSG